MLTASDGLHGLPGLSHCRLLDFGIVINRSCDDGRRSVCGTCTDRVRSPCREWEYGVKVESFGHPDPKTNSQSPFRSGGIEQFVRRFFQTPSEGIELTVPAVFLESGDDIAHPVDRHRQQRRGFEVGD